MPLSNAQRNALDRAWRFCTRRATAKANAANLPHLALTELGQRKSNQLQEESDDCALQAIILKGILEDDTHTVTLLKRLAGLTPATKDSNPGIGAGMLNSLIEDAQALLLEEV